MSGNAETPYRDASLSRLCDLRVSFTFIQYRTEHAKQMTSTTLLIGAATILTSSLYLFLVTAKRIPIDPETLPSVVLPSYTSHARLLPVPSKHTFSYPLIYLGVDIDTVEKGSVNLPWRVFRYGHSWFNVLGLRSFNYLHPGSESLRSKLDSLLAERGLSQDERERAWMVSMPSLLGFEGINPLTVWYVYDKTRRLSCIILEVHNTFGEK